MADQIEENAEEGEGGGSRRRGGLPLVVGGLAAGLLLGAGVMYFLGTGSEDGSEADARQEAGEAESPPEDPVDLLVVNVRRFVVPLQNEDMELLGYVWVDFAVEVDGPDNQSYVSARIPELRDAFLRDLHLRQTTRKERPGALDFDLLQERLETIAQDTLGDDRILAVRIVNARPVPE